MSDQAVPPQESLRLESIEGARIVRWALVILVFLLAGHALALVCKYAWGLDYALGVIPLFDLDTEANLPTVFAGILLASCGLLALSISRAERAEGRASYKGWRWVGGILIFLAVDECGRVHENFDFILMPLVETKGALDWPWVIPYFLLVLVVGAILARFYLALPRVTQVGLAMAGTLYVGGAIGMELVAAKHAETHGMENLTYALFYTIEETLEFSGCLMTLRTLFVYAERFGQGLPVKRMVSWRRSAQVS